MQNHYSIESAFSTVYLDLPEDNSNWQAELSSFSPQPGISVISFTIRSATPQIPPCCNFSWSIPQHDIAFRWYCACDRRDHMPPNWGGRRGSQLAYSAPVMTLYNQSGPNRFSFAASEAKREVGFGAGVNEYNSNIDCFVAFFESPEAPRTEYSAQIIVNTEAIFYADAIRKIFDWYADMDEYQVAPAPEAAFDLLYSSWYSYHKDNLHSDIVQRQLGYAAQYGMKTLIVDDGWQTDRYNGGPYAYCGDWQPVVSRFPNMKEHVKKVHEAGFKYILWYSVPFVGEKSENFARFQGKYLYTRLTDAHILDPRFPEVREFLISTYENAVREWDLDGFKLDFIDSFPVAYANDPAVAENFGNGRDCKTVPEGVDKLMTGVITRLRQIKSDILIEFRQNYIGPAIRKYGNMLRAADCPGDLLLNRVRTIDLRITASPQTAIHSDMLTWNYSDSAEVAARQFLAILFSVPQISVRLEEIPPLHGRMLKFWTGFWTEHRDLLLFGHLKPFHPELNYPLVQSELEEEEIFAIYLGQQVITPTSGKTTYLVNSSENTDITVDLSASRLIKVYNTLGELTADLELPPGLHRLNVPISGLARLD